MVFLEAMKLRGEARGMLRNHADTLEASHEITRKLYESRITRTMRTRRSSSRERCAAATEWKRDETRAKRVDMAATDIWRVGSGRRKEKVESEHLW